MRYRDLACAAFVFRNKIIIKAAASSERTDLTEAAAHDGSGRDKSINHLHVGVTEVISTSQISAKNTTKAKATFIGLNCSHPLERLFHLQTNAGVIPKKSPLLALPIISIKGVLTFRDSRRKSNKKETSRLFVMLSGPGKIKRRLKKTKRR